MPANFGNMITIEGSGGLYGTSTFFRGFSDPTVPLIKATRSGNRVRDWEFRLRGLNFDGQKLDGTSLDLEYAQLSIFEDLRFNSHGSDTGTGIPFRIGAHTCNACEFRDIQLTQNRNQAEILRASDFRWRGGATHTNWGAGGVQRESGLYISAPPNNPPNEIAGPGLVEDIHAEGGEITITGVRNMSYKRGFHNNANVRIQNATNAHWDCDRVWYGASLEVNAVIKCSNNT